MYHLSLRRQAMNLPVCSSPVQKQLCLIKKVFVNGLQLPPRRIDLRLSHYPERYYFAQVAFSRCYSRQSTMKRRLSSVMTGNPYIFSRYGDQDDRARVCWWLLDENFAAKTVEFICFVEVWHRTRCCVTDQRVRHRRMNAVNVKNTLQLRQMMNIRMLTTSLDRLILTRWIVFDNDKTCVISVTSIHLGIDTTYLAWCRESGNLSSCFTVSSCLFDMDQNQISHNCPVRHW